MRDNDENSTDCRPEPVARSGMVGLEARIVVISTYVRPMTFMNGRSFMRRSANRDLSRTAQACLFALRDVGIGSDRGQLFQMRPMPPRRRMNVRTADCARAR